jgi:hypothetical protein
MAGGAQRAVAPGGVATGPGGVATRPGTIRGSVLKSLRLAGAGPGPWPEEIAASHAPAIRQIRTSAEMHAALADEGDARGMRHATAAGGFRRGSASATIAAPEADD